MNYRMWRVGLFLQSALIVSAASVIALGYNAVRADSLDWVADSEYEIYDECPEGEEEAAAVSLEELQENPDYFFLVDSRMPDEFGAEHAEGALSVPYDPLFPISEEEIGAVKEAAGDRTVVVIGDVPTARLLANDFLNQGVGFVQYLNEDEDWRALLGAAAE
ncbi:MAG: rhodanese-like domain-containing protein [Candidatus Eisenbacteria bacterium]